MARVISIGTATQDVYLAGDVFTPECEAGVCYEHLKLGDKLYAEKAYFTTGGNAGNAAVTFARQGHDSIFVGAIGDDPTGREIQQDFKDEKVDTSLLNIEASYETSYSVVLLAPSGERTILRVKGSGSADHGHENFLDDIEADWLYVSSLGSMELLEKVITAAKKNNIKVAFNPGTKELEQKEKLKNLLPSVSIVMWNTDEAATQFEGKTKEELARASAAVVDMSVVTDGPDGVAVSDGKDVYSAGVYEDVPVKDRLGAGDAFCSGFTSAIAGGESIERAMTLASANSTSVVQYIGAKEGILRSDAKVHDMDITKE